MENNFDLTIVLPIKSSIVAFFDDFFTKSIESIKNQEVKPSEIIIVHTLETSLKEILKFYHNLIRLKI